MRHISSFIIGLVFSIQIQAQVRVIFDTTNLYVPEGIQMILKTLPNDDGFTLLYDRMKSRVPIAGIMVSRKFIGISHVNGLYDGSCSYRQFFDATLMPDSNHHCGKRDVYQFIDIFGNGSVWINPQNKKKYYFFDDKKDHMIHVFFPDLARKTVFSMQSNFLTIEQMQQLFIKPDE